MNPSIPLPDLTPAFEGIEPRSIIKHIVLTLILWGMTLLARHVVISFLRRRGLPPSELRRVIATTRNLVVVVLLAATITLWFEEVKTFAISLVAVAAAVVIATKELIMGAAGTFLRSSGRIFDIGDRIEINGLRGDVVDTSLFTTTILEIGPGHVGHQQTGRAVTLPNSLFLSSPVINESFSDPFVLHTFEIPVDADDWEGAEADIVAACAEEQNLYVEDARKHFERRQKDRGLEMPSLEPRLLMRMDTAEHITMIARLAVPARRKGRIEQAILRRYLTRRFARLGPRPATPLPHTKRPS